MKEILANFRFLALETEHQIALTEELLTDFNLELLEKIASKDDYIDNLKNIVENACFAGIYSMRKTDNREEFNRIRAIHIISVNLERIADYCVNITRQTKYLSSMDVIQQYDYRTMFQVIRKSLATVTSVFDRGDLTGALHVCRAEFELDDLWAATFKELLNELNRSRKANDLITVIFIFRYLERIGDSILNIGEALLFAIIGDRIKIRQFEALEKTLNESGFKGTLSDIDFSSIWGSRSGCRISKVSRKKPSGFKAQGIFKEGQVDKIRRERENFKRWESILPGLAPKVFAYYERADTASMLIEYITGCTLEQMLLTEEETMVQNVLFIFEQTLKDIWKATLRPGPFLTDAMDQLLKRLSGVEQVHPECLRSPSEKNGVFVPSTRERIRLCRELEKELPSPFTVFVHGDFNINNIVYNHDGEKVNYIDLHRSRDADYVQDASVFLVSNFRLPVFEPSLRMRLNEVIDHFMGVFREFASSLGDQTFEARMALALARSFLTSTRFELEEGFAEEMADRAHQLLDQVAGQQGRPWETFRLPEDILVFEPAREF